MPKRNIFVRQENSFWRAEGKWARFSLFIIFLVLLGFLGTAVKPWETIQNSSIPDEHSNNHFSIGLWYGFLTSLIILLMLLITWKKWSLPKPKIKKVSEKRAEKSQPSTYWILIILIVIFGGFLRWELVTGSLSWEEYKILGGSSERSTPVESLTFSENWTNILLDYPSSDKSHLLSAVLKVSHSVWSFFANVERVKFSEFALRLPNFCASLFSILLVGILLKNWGFGGAGILCSFLLAMHPWHIERGILVGPDGILIFLLLITILSIIYSINDQTGKWRSWITLSIVQFLISYLIPQGIFIAIGFMICAIVLVVHKEANYSNRSFFINRIIASHALGLAAFSPLLFTNMIQISEWKKIPTYGYEYLGNTIDSISKTLWGIPFSTPQEMIDLSINTDSVGISFINNPIITSIVILTSIAAIVTGFIQTWLHKEGVAKILVTITMLGTLSILLSSIISQHPQHRFVSLMIIPILIFMSIGLIQSLTLFKNRYLLSSFLLLLLVSLQLAINSKQRKLTFNLSYSPQKEINKHLQQRKINLDKPFEIVSYGFGGDLMKLYSPDLKVIRTSDKLKEIIKKSKNQNQEVLVLFGYRYLNSMNPENKDAIALLDSGTRFHMSRKFIGLDPMSEHEIFRLLPETN
ncbi:MAG: hypothetical protein H2077_04245 [Verrucomicrobiales bacterium]|nr:hypothetical protein [Verrucomicrobiales bacterium]